MALKAGRIDEVLFITGSLISNAAGLFDVHSTTHVNGEIIGISVGSNNYTNTGSLLIFFSGTNSLTGADLILRLRAGSMMQTFYPFTQKVDNQSLTWTAGSVVPTNFFGNGPIRVVGSGVGNITSGLFISVKYR